MARCFLDTGVQTTVVEHTQADAYCRCSDVKLKTKNKKNSYHFGSDIQKSLGSISIQVVLLDTMVALVSVDVVPSNVPFLIDLGILGKFQMIVDNVKNVF